MSKKVNAMALTLDKVYSVTEKLFGKN